MTVPKRRPARKGHAGVVRGEQRLLLRRVADEGHVGRVPESKKDTGTANMRGHGVLTIARTMIGSENITIVSLDRVV